MQDLDPVETQEWLDALESVLDKEGEERAHYLMTRMGELATRTGSQLPYAITTPYRNTIPVTHEARMPGDLFMERRIRSLVRWNAMAMVMRTNLKDSDLGGHISSFASSATLYDIGFNYFFQAPTDEHGGDRAAHARGRGTDRNGSASRTDGSSGHRTRAELRPTRYQARRNARPEDAQREHGQRGQHDDQRLVDGGLGSGRYIELDEQSRADAHDDGEYQHLDARRHHIAQDLLGKERRLVPQREWHQYEARQCGQLKLDQRDEELHRQHEETDDDHDPGEEQHNDGRDVDEHLRESRKLPIDPAGFIRKPCSG